MLGVTNGGCCFSFGRCCRRRCCFTDGRREKGSGFGSWRGNLLLFTCRISLTRINSDPYKTLKANVPETIAAEWKEIYDAVLKQKGKDQVCSNFHIQRSLRFPFTCILTPAGICYTKADVHRVSGKFDGVLYGYPKHAFCS